jgi:phospholipase C
MERFTAVKSSRFALPIAAMLTSMVVVAAESTQHSRHPSATTTPIKHLIVVVGENVSFDTLYGAYLPPRGRSVLNLLSQRIINADGTPGPRFAKAIRHQGADRGSRYTIEPTQLEAYAQLPQPLLTGVFNPQTLQPYGMIPDPRFAALNTLVLA